MERHEELGILIVERTYHNLYYKAEMWDMEGLKNSVLNVIRTFHSQIVSSMHPILVIAAYANTLEDSSLRRYVAHSALFAVESQEEYLPVMRSGTEAPTHEFLYDILSLLPMKHIIGNPDSTVSRNRCEYRDHKDGTSCT